MDEEQLKSNAGELDKQQQTGEPEGQTQGDDKSKDGAGDGDGGDKTFTQPEVDQLIKDRLTRAEAKWQKAIDDKVEAKLKERQRLSEMSESELEAERISQREQELSAREQVILRNELRGDTEQVLRERKLPASFAPFLLADDKEQTLENIKAFQEAYTESVKEAVKSELSGKTPERKSTTKETVWTREKIARVKDQNKRLQLIAENKELYQ